MALYSRFARRPGGAAMDSFYLQRRAGLSSARHQENAMPGKIDARLAELNITLPEPPAPVASYVPYVVSGKLVFVSGQVTLADGGLKYVGIVGKELSLEDGKAAARLCAINVLAQLRTAAGSNLDNVKRCVRLGVFVNAAPGFAQHPEVANGASDLIVEVFGEAGRHARAAVGAGSLPRNVAVEVDAVFELA
jgi:enamine deaminase RidA (YjgF/YER057c/UK114 family)